MNVDELRAEAKAAGIKNHWNKKPETLERELYGGRIHEEKQEPAKGQGILPAQEPKAPKLEVMITECDMKFFDTIGLKVEWLASLANQYAFTRFEYMHKFKAFRCYRGGKQVDWIDVNDLSLLNGGAHLFEIMQKHQPVEPRRAVINLKWRPIKKVVFNDPSIEKNLNRGG